MKKILMMSQDDDDSVPEIPTSYYGESQKKKVKLKDFVKKEIPKTREEQYSHGQTLFNLLNTDSKIGKKVLDKLINDEKDQLKETETKSLPKRIITALQQLFVKQMAPVLIFNPVSLECVELVRQLVRCS